MDRHKLILALPAGAQERLFATLWRTGRIWKVAEYEVLRRVYVMCGADERAMRDIAKRARSRRHGRSCGKPRLSAHALGRTESSKPDT